jgi:uncharacterized membrane protein (DUF106 family)
MVKIQRKVLNYLTVIISQNTFTLAVAVTAVAVAVAVELKRKFLLNQNQAGVTK